MGLFFVAIGALLASLANFFIRKNLDNHGSAKGHLLASFGCSLLVSLILNSDILKVSFSISIFFTGIITGTLIAAMMGLTALTLSKGPSGLTFAFQTSGSVFPAIILFILFGKDFGYVLTLPTILGLILVLLGLIWAAKDFQKESLKINPKWIFFASGLFLLHLLLLTVIQWRCLSFANVPEHILIPFRSTPEEDVWFTPGLFLAAFMIQLFVVWRSGKGPSKRDLVLGSLGGSFNGAATYCLFFASTLATPVEIGILFPAFSVGIILFCNLWGYFLYSERINWFAHGLCSAGILLAS